MRHIAIFAVPPAILLALLVASCAATTTTGTVPATAPAPAKTTPALPKDNECFYIWDESEKISCYTAEIRSGKYSGIGLAVAYSKRGHSYLSAGGDFSFSFDDPARSIEDYDRAIADYDQALRLEKTLRPADWKPTMFSLYFLTNMSRDRARRLRASAQDFLDRVTPRYLGPSSPSLPQVASSEEVAEKNSTGTGFYVDVTGSILTNAHVVEKCRALTVGDGLPAELLALDGSADLALLRAPASPANAIARFAAGPARLNASVTVIGFPLHGLLGGLNVTRGSVSSTSGVGGDDAYFQMTAAVQPGNSGGPVVNEFGAVVGVVQSKLDALKVAAVIGDIPQNINFAIRAELAKQFLTKHSVDFQITTNQVRVEPSALADDAKGFTVLVSCWNG